MKLVPGTWLHKPDPEHEHISQRLHRYRLCYFWYIYMVLIWKQAPGCTHLAPQQYCVLPSNMSRRSISSPPCANTNQRKDEFMVRNKHLIFGVAFLSPYGFSGSSGHPCSRSFGAPSYGFCREVFFDYTASFSMWFPLSFSTWKCCQSSWIFLPWLKLTVTNENTGKYTFA